MKIHIKTFNFKLKAKLGSVSATLNFWRSQSGYTLIEMLVVIAIIAIIGTMSTQILLSIIKSNNKTNIQNEVRQNGSFVVGMLERDIRAAKSATVTLSEVVTNEYILRLVQNDGTTITYWCYLSPNSTSNGHIKRRYGTESEEHLLNTDLVSGVKVASCSISVSASPPALVTIDFTLTQAVSSPNRTDLTVSQQFKTSVSLRTY